LSALFPYPFSVPSILRSRIALLTLLGAFLIPIGMSNLRGLTHVLTCKQEAETPFTLINDGPEPQLLSSTRISADDDEFVCGGLSLNMGARGEGPGKVTMILPITNHSKYLWQGTVTLKLGNTTVPADIGEIGPGETQQDEIPIELEPGALEVNGSLLIGP
jgi:hypothetical protein